MAPGPARCPEFGEDPVASERLRPLGRLADFGNGSSSTLPSYKIGASRRFDPADVDAFLAQFREEGPQDR